MTAVIWILHNWKLNIAITVNIAIFLKTASFIEHIWWLLLNSKLILATHILTKTKWSNFYILIIATQTKQIIFFSYMTNINENLKKTDEKKCCFKDIYYSHRSNTGNCVGKKGSQKFHLHMRFITCLNQIPKCLSARISIQSKA